MGRKRLSASSNLSPKNAAKRSATKPPPSAKTKRLLLSDSERQHFPDPTKSITGGKSLLDSSSESNVDSDDDMSDLRAARARLANTLERLALGKTGQEQANEDSDNQSPPSPKKRQAALKAQKQFEQHQLKPYEVSFLDRKIDLAPIAIKMPHGTHEMPLYPICREWQRNGRESEVEILRKNLHPENDKLDAEKGMESGVRRLPDPLPVKREKYEKDRSVRIPRNVVKPVVNVYEIDEAINGEESKEKLLAENMARWKKVRADWVSAGHENEKRYQHSCSVLKAMYEKSQSCLNIEPKMEIDP